MFKYLFCFLLFEKKEIFFKEVNGMSVSFKAGQKSKKLNFFLVSKSGDGQESGE